MDYSRGSSRGCSCSGNMAISLIALITIALLGLMAVALLDLMAIALHLGLVAIAILGLMAVPVVRVGISTCWPSMYFST